MLQIGHRESRDVDIFLTDPQLLPFLNPQTNEFRFEIQPDAYECDGARSLKFVFRGIGEIDFIVAGAMTPSPTTQASVEGESVLLETIPEIITKKVYYRASNIAPRDIFDIAAAGEQHEDSLIEVLKGYRDHVKQTLAAISELNPVFVDRAIAALSIKDQYKDIAAKAIERSKGILGTVLQAE